MRDEWDTMQHNLNFIYTELYLHSSLPSNINYGYSIRST